MVSPAPAPPPREVRLHPLLRLHQHEHRLHHPVGCHPHHTSLSRTPQANLCMHTSKASLQAQLCMHPLKGTPVSAARTSGLAQVGAAFLATVNGGAVVPRVVYIAPHRVQETGRVHRHIEKVRLLWVQRSVLALRAISTLLHRLVWSLHCLRCPGTLCAP